MRARDDDDAELERVCNRLRELFPAALDLRIGVQTRELQSGRLIASRAGADVYRTGFGLERHAYAEVNERFADAQRQRDERGSAQLPSVELDGPYMRRADLGLAAWMLVAIATAAVVAVLVKLVVGS